MSSNLPNDFICPITNEIMVDPVIDPDGNSYERQAIMEWLERHQNSPITRNTLYRDQLVPNRALKSMIESYRERDPAAFSNFVPPARNNSGTTAATSGAPVENSTPIAIEEDEPLTRAPIMLFAVIDTSGSMQESCGGQQTENDGYSRLDLVKHTLNTLFTSLSSHDSASVIKFSTVADVFIPLTKLTSDNKRIVMERLKHLEPENQTNLWDGLRLAIEEIVGLGEQIAGYNVQMYVLTDGEPNLNPPGVLSEVLDRYLQTRCPNIRLTINTFGYGYKLDSEMLFNISRVGKGFFGFIPDATMVGTVFINALANSLITEKLSLDEQSQDAVDRCVTLLGHLIETGSPENRQAYLYRFADFLEGEEGRASNPKTREFIINLQSDCLSNPDPNYGQISKAIETRFYREWGKHYLRSVLSAYINQVCINFKDKGIQSFKTPAFIEEQKRIENIFVLLPPPRPSNQRYSNRYGGGNTASAPPTATNMAQYYNAAGGCFTGESLVEIPNSEGSRFVKVQDLRTGSVVLSEKGPTNVELIVKIRYTGELYRLGSSMQLTAYHPVMVDCKDFFPCQCPYAVRAKDLYDGYVYDVVLENRSLLSGGILNDKKRFYLATFGHSKKSAIFSHDYFGSEKIVQDLKASHPTTWSKELIVSEKPVYHREEEKASSKIIRITW